MVAAEELVAVLRIIRASGPDDALVQRAKGLNLQLAPVYERIYGRTPLLTTTRPLNLWLSDAEEWASQALAAIESGFFQSTGDEWLRGQAPMLKVILEAENAGNPLTYGDLVAAMDRPEPEVEASLRALLDGHIVTGIDTSSLAGFDVIDLRLTSSGRSVESAFRETSPVPDTAPNTTDDAIATVSSDPADTSVDTDVPLASEFNFDVAVSYSRANENQVRSVVNALESEGVRVWWDQDNQAEAWGSNLETLFADVFANRARYVMVFLSESYTVSDWTRFELEVAQSASRSRETAYVLPVVVDEHVPAVVGLSRMIGFVSLRDHTAEEIARLLREKIASGNG